MTQAFNLSQLANRVNTSGQLDASTGLYNVTPVANGGTGLSSAGTAGYVLTSTGSAFVMASPTAGNINGVVYTSGTATWTAPAGVNKIFLLVIGGGGGGSGTHPGEPYSGNRGGYGGLATGYITVSPSTGYAITVGAGGNGTNANSSNGSAGSSSSFSSLVIATGGAGGTYPIPAPPQTPGANGTGTGGTLMNGHVGTNSDGGIYPTPFGGYNARDNAVSSTTAIAFSINGSYAPGGFGSGEEFDEVEIKDNATGGVGGLVYIQYIG